MKTLALNLIISKRFAGAMDFVLLLPKTSFFFKERVRNLKCIWDELNYLWCPEKLCMIYSQPRLA